MSLQDCRSYLYMVKVIWRKLWSVISASFSLNWEKVLLMWADNRNLLLLVEHIG